MRQSDGLFQQRHAARVCSVMLVVVVWFTSAILSGALMPSSAHAAENSILGLRLGVIGVEGDAAQSEQTLRVVIETRTPVTPRVTLLHDPYRLVVDMPATHWQVENVPPRGILAKPPARAYRFGKPTPDMGRVVIELDAPAIPVRRFSLPPENGGYRLVLDLVDRGATAFSVAAKVLSREQMPVSRPLANASPALPAEPLSATVDASNGAANTTPVPKPAAVPKPADAASPATASTVATPLAKPRKWVVFIDAGHGGKDPGAIGHSKTQEKHITLAAALELARQLRATGVVEPVLSRDDDRYLRLRERIQLARSREADVFISLHADAAPSAKAYGLSIFTLSDTASDKEAALLAKKENQADLIGGPDLAVEDPQAADELLRMFQRESMNQSTYLASAILNQIGDLPGGTKRGHRFAGFAVLKAPDMPSVLVEMGFVTNRRDESNLKKESYRRKVVERLARAIIAYLEEYGPRR
ncbi:MAG TPA: N-acetylmuramoyl-L-alanine amidase [Alphaproteobacteria bacterium]|nr:N-acetylmuramoyl-L-alanine amidase [Alphaproteobacteria bacterium]